MDTEDKAAAAKWLMPNELLKLQRLKQKKRKLNARLTNNNSYNNNNNNTNNAELSNAENKTRLLEAKIAQKRKNPFAKTTTTVDNSNKKFKPNTATEEDSLFSFALTTTSASTAVAPLVEKPKPAPLRLKPFNAQEFAKLLYQPAVTTEDDSFIEHQTYTKHLPIDWSLKSRIRFFCATELPATQLKASQLASGLTSFVRCIDTKDPFSGLDYSPASLFNQSTYYWQHPYLPWLTLFPRNSKDNVGYQLGDNEKKSLLSDWDFSFRGLFQLLRSRQCPYFYLCANTFTVLFRAAGTSGCVEIHALVTPTTRGMRQLLEKEDIKFTMPLKKDNKAAATVSTIASAESANEINTTQMQTQTPLDNTNSTKVEITEAADVTKNSVDITENDDNDDDDEKWIESLGVDERDMRKMQSAHTIKLKQREMTDDFSDSSLLLIEGIECLAFFTYLLNAKSTISSIGRLAGVPPTLLAPIAFPRATMQHLTARNNKVHMDGTDYYSVDLKGIVLPTVLPYVCQLLGETKKTFSASITSNNLTLAFTKATQKLLEEPRAKNNADTDNEDDETSDKDDAGNDVDGQEVFGQKNLSDCGLRPAIIEDICRTGVHAVALLERVSFDKDFGYAWS